MRGQRGQKGCFVTNPGGSDVRPAGLGRKTSGAGKGNCGVGGCRFEWLTCRSLRSAAAADRPRCRPDSPTLGSPPRHSVSMLSVDLHCTAGAHSRTVCSITQRSRGCCVALSERGALLRAGRTSLAVEPRSAPAGRPTKRRRFGPAGLQRTVGAAGLVEAAASGQRSECAGHRRAQCCDHPALNADHS